MKEQLGHGSRVETEANELMRPQQISGWVHFHEMHGQNHFHFRKFDLELRDLNQTKQLLQGAVVLLGVETLSHLKYTVKKKEMSHLRETEGLEREIGARIGSGNRSD